jgi:hypothetical protein
VPPVTSRLAQQLSLDEPQLLKPEPLVVQLVPVVGATQEPLLHTGVLPEHAVAFCQAPVELHVCGCVPEKHCTCPGAQFPVHAPLTHVWLEQALPLFCQVPVALQFCGCCPLHWVWVGPHTPPQVPVALMHVRLAVHAEPLFCQLPVRPHVWGCCPLHWNWPGAHEPWHVPLTHVLLEQAAPLFCHMPLALQFCGC